MAHAVRAMVPEHRRAIVTPVYVRAIARRRCACGTLTKVRLVTPATPAAFRKLTPVCDACREKGNQQ